MKIEVSGKSIVHVVATDLTLHKEVCNGIRIADLHVKTYATVNELIEDYQPEISGCVILDIHNHEVSNLRQQDQLAEASVRLPVIVVTKHGSVSIAVSAMKKGAFEFLQRPLTHHVVLNTVYSAIQHHRVILAKDDQSRKVQNCMNSLTMRERQVLALIRAGKPNKIIASQLDISIRTVEAHRTHIMSKMNAKHTIELIQIFCRDEQEKPQFVAQ